MAPSRPPSPTSLLAPLEGVRGLGPKRIAAWATFDIATLADLLRWPPRRHVRFAPPTAIAALPATGEATLRVQLVRKQASGRRGIVATRLTVADASGELGCVMFGPRWLASAFARHEELLLRASAPPLSEARGARSDWIVRGWLHAEELATLPAAAAAYQPHYELPDEVAPRLHRRCLRALLAAPLEELAAPLPAAVRARSGGLATLRDLFTALHFPRDDAEAAAARRCFAFEEAVAIQERLAIGRAARPLRPLAHGEELQGTLATWLADYLAAWPEPCTADQLHALDELVGDYGRPQAMARVLSGEVGSGKTRVALFPLVVAARRGRQGALLAPTELLARQHHATLTRLAAALRLPPPQLLVAGETGESGDPGAVAAALPTRSSRRRTAVDAPFVVGTHRLFAEPLSFRDLAAVVIDEQHKFGVRQRGRLLDKGTTPDLLLVSATPIPRTLAQTLLGHLDRSQLRVRPFGPLRIDCELLAGERRRELGARLRSELAAGGKIFVVCPAIAASGKPGGRAAAERVAPWVAREVAGATPVALLHGRLDGAEKRARLADFAEGRARVLVATVVIEVGLDIPDATMVVVLDADRFGLAQLHQIRGRVGRRGERARCLLVSQEPSPAAHERLLEFGRLDDGFALAELDLRLRGPGELLGTRQHGVLAGLYPEALLDPELVEAARAAVAAGARKSLPGHPFGASAVASTEAIW